jgi:hypothetical protein
MVMGESLLLGGNSGSGAMRLGKFKLGGIPEGPNLQGVDISSVNLSDAFDITQERTDSAIIDEETMPLDYLRSYKEKGHPVS